MLGIIGVGGLVFQWAQSIIDRWYKDIEDLQTRVTSLESRSTTVSVPQSVLTSISTLQTPSIRQHTINIAKYNLLTAERD